MKYLGILVIFILGSLFVNAQDAVQKDKITLNSGEVYVGEILVQNTEMIMLKSADGTRYQFQIAEIKMIEKDLVPIKPVVEPIARNLSSVSFSGFLELTGGVSSAKNCILTSPNAQLALIFGSNNVFQKNLFFGLGIGINNAFVSSNSSSIGFLPLFIRLQSTLTKSRTAPFVGMDAGYAFALTHGF